MNDLYDSTRQGWSDMWEDATVADELATMYYPRSQAIMQACLPWLPRDAPVLEAGSGLGGPVIALRAAGHSNVIGMDYVESALRAARRHTPGLPLFTGDIHAIPCADSTIGAYLSFGVLEHFEQGMGPALAEARRVLRAGGILVLTIPYPSLVQRLVAGRRRLLGKGPLVHADFYERTYGRRELVANVVDAGFELCALRPTSHDYTLWSLGGPFRAPGYYRSSRLAETLGAALARLLPWAFNYTTLIIARKPA
ncbi:MAG: class I SAM-dependent methyltransferase [Anaerolineaceae bacterium]|nr:class I SAM-dependent methyltransferase [Anaerolineaceae bacterium]